MRARWLVVALLGWVPGLDMGSIEAGKEVDRHVHPSVERGECNHGCVVEGESFLVWDEDARAAKEWASELQGIGVARRGQRPSGPG